MVLNRRPQPTGGSRLASLRYPVHVLAATPAVLLVCGIYGLAGRSLGPDPVEYLLRELGWWGLTWLVATLAITPLSRGLHQPLLMRLRRPLGLWAFAYAMAHLGVYLVLDRQLVWSEILTDLGKRPYIMAGMAAVVLLLPLAATSNARSMRALGRRWQVLHRLAYPATTLGVLHFALQVKKDLTEPLLYAVVLGVLLGWRAWRALNRPRTRPSPDSSAPRLP